MKPLPLFLAALLLLPALAACGGSPEEAPAQDDAQTQEVQTAEETAPTEEIQAPAEDAPSLAQLREEIETTGNLMGVAYLGTLSEGGQEAYDELVADWLDARPFLADLDWEKAAVASGMEVYCVVPRDAGSLVTVTEWVIDESNGYQGQAGQVLYEGQSGEPVLLMGNVSDILPNLRVTVTAPDGQSLTYSPCLSLCDGTLDRAATEGIYDFSLYFDLPPAGIPDYSGDWAAFDVADGDGQLYTCCLTLNQNGAADFFYYQELGVILERFTGTARDNDDDDTVTLDWYLTGGTYLEGGAPEHGAIGTYRMEMPDQDTLYLLHLDGDPLLHGLEGQAVVFGRSVG